jgi:outer membrane protein assembly factor BamB
VIHSPSARSARSARLLAGALVAAAAAACGPMALDQADSMRAVPREKPGLDLLSLRWKLETGDRSKDVHPQEFAGAAVWADTVYIGGESGELFAVRATTGALRWRKKIGAVSSTPAVARGLLYVGTVDGYLICLDAQTGDERWRYQSKGAMSEPPVIDGDTLVFSNEADQVYGLHATKGSYKWQYKSETPENYTLRGHAGIAIDDGLAFTGFANGSMVALRVENGSVAWSTSLKGEADKFVDVDGTPVVVGATVYVASSSGGLYALDKTTGLIRWRAPIFDSAAPAATGVTGGIAADRDRLYLAAADLGIYALDHDGNVLWRQGTRGGGEPATPVVDGELLVYTLAGDGVYLADRKTGEVYEYFQPGEGVSATPTATDDGGLFVMSNRGILYAFDLDQP